MSTERCYFKMTWLLKSISVIRLILIILTGVWSDWKVDFTNLSPCAVRGSSVVLGCQYYYPAGQTVTKRTWFRNSYNIIVSDPADSGDSRVRLLGDRQNNCSVLIQHLHDGDDSTYVFRFETNIDAWSSKNVITLHLTGLTVTVNPTTVREQENVTLTCTTACNLPGNPTMVWFRDGQPVLNPEFQASREDAGNYTCAVKGQETGVRSYPVVLDVHYPPVSVVVSVHPPGPVKEGSSVNLTCSSEANPAVDSYTWYRRTGPPSSCSLVGLGQVLSLASLNSSQTGHYLCQARNSVGETNSTLQPVILQRVPVLQKSVVSTLVLVGVAVLLFALFLVALFIWRRHKMAVGMEMEESSCQGEEDVVYSTVTVRPRGTRPPQHTESPGNLQDHLQSAPQALRVQEADQVTYSTVTVRPRESRPPHHTESPGNLQDHLQSAPQAFRVQEADEVTYSTVTVRSRGTRPPQHTESPGNLQDHLQSAPQALRVQEADQVTYSTVRTRQTRPPHPLDQLQENVIYGVVAAPERKN